MTLNNDRIIKKIYLLTTNNGKYKTHSNSSSWGMKIKGILKKYGMEQLFYNNNNILYNLDGNGNMEAKTIYDHKKYWIKYVIKNITNYEEQTWKNDLKNTRKLCNYRMFKQKIKLENYLNCNNHVVGRRYHTALRTGSNKLEQNKVGGRDFIDRNVFVNNVVVVRSKMKRISYYFVTNTF